MAAGFSLLFDRIRWDEKAIEKAASRRRVSVRLIDAKELRLDSHDASEIRRRFGDAPVLQRCISHFRGLHATAYLEGMGYRVINSLATNEVCGNKMLTTLALQRAGVPTPHTKIAFTAEAAMRALEELGYPAVLKPIVGSWGRSVVPLRDREVAQAVVEMRELGNGPLGQIFYLQEMVQRPPRDIRCVVVDDEIVAATYRNAAPGEWLTNVARGGVSTPCPITKELEDIALRATKAVGGGILGVDAMESPNGLVIHEVNGTVEFRGAAAATRADIAGAIVRYVRSVDRR